VTFRNIQTPFIIIFTTTLFLTPLCAQTPSNDDESNSEAQTRQGAASSTTPSKIDKRLFGVLPNYRTVDASIPFAPLSPRRKLSIAGHDSFDWPTYVLAAALTFITPGGKETSSYGSGLGGFANRYLRSSADQIAGNMLAEGFLPILLRQDPRYFRPGTGATWSRMRSALIQTAVAHDDKGRHVFTFF